MKKGNKGNLFFFFFGFIEISKTELKQKSLREGKRNGENREREKFNKRGKVVFED